MAAEAEPCAEGESHEPVGAKVAEHGRARIAGAAECAGGDGLDAVEELEGGAGGKQADGGVNEDGIVGVNARDVFRKDEKDNAHAGHEGGAKKNGGVAGNARAGEIAAADGLADADGGGGGDAEGNHVGEGDGVERDLVAGEWNRAEPRDERGDGGENADFGGELDAGGETEADEAADACEIRSEFHFAQAGMIVRIVPEEIKDEDGGQIGAGDDGGDAGADDAQLWKAEVAEDEGVVAEEVDDVRGDESERDWADDVHALECAAKGEIEKQGQEAEGEGVHVRAGEDGDVWGDAEEREEPGQQPDGNDQERQENQAEINAVDEGVVTVVALAGAESLGDEGIQADEQAFAEEDEDEEETGADADGGDGLGRIGKATDHHGVYDGHADPADFGEDKGKRKAKGRTELGAEGGPGEHWLVYRLDWAKVK